MMMVYINSKYYSSSQQRMALRIRLKEIVTNLFNNNPPPLPFTGQDPQNSASQLSLASHPETHSCSEVFLLFATQTIDWMDVTWKTQRVLQRWR